MPEIIQPTQPAELAMVAQLFHEYAEWLGDRICLHDFTTEMRGFPAPYKPPAGALFLARDGDEAVGAVGIRPLGPEICEMKRLFVRPEARGRGLGRALAEASLAWARAAGYDAMRLDTLVSLDAARALYESLGFVTIPAYNPNPPDRVLFFEKKLRAP